MQMRNVSTLRGGQTVCSNTSVCTMHPVPDWISNASTAMQVPEALVVRLEVGEIDTGSWPSPQIKQTDIGSTNTI
jgi:hypothetical protein